MERDATPKGGPDPFRPRKGETKAGNSRVFKFIKPWKVSFSILFLFKKTDVIAGKHPCGKGNYPQW